MSRVLLEVEVSVIEVEEYGDSSVIIVVVEEMVGTQEGVSGEIGAESGEVAKNEGSVGGKNSGSKSVVSSGIMSGKVGWYEVEDCTSWVVTKTGAKI